MRSKILAAFSLMLVLSFPSLFVLTGLAPSLFGEGFESGDFSAWTASAGATVQSSTVHHGTYAARTSANDDYFYKDFVQGYTIYARAYVRWDTSPASGDFLYLFYLNYGPGYAGNRVLLSLVNDGGIVKWRLLGYKNDGTFETVTFDTPNPNTNTWYCVELKWQANTESGASLYVDGSLLGSIIGVTDNSAVGNLYFKAWQGFPSGGHIFFDCVTVDSNYIGPEPADTTPPTFGNISANSTVAGTPCSFSCLINDDSNVSSYLFSTNNTGSWVNDTTVAFSSFLNATASWANVTKALNDTVGNVVSYMWYANDTSNNWSHSDQHSLTSSSPIYTLTTSVVGSGSVYLNNSGPYHYGDVVELTAVPTAGWSFDHWSGDLSGSANPATILIDGNKTVNATFTQNVYTLTVSLVGSGSVDRNNSGPYHYSNVVELTAVPSTGWSFDHWGGDLSGSGNPATILIDGNKSVIATFTQNAYTLTISIDGSGSVDRNNSGPYYYGDVVELTAVPSIGWTFDHWHGDLSSSSNPATILVDGNKSVTTYFTQNTYNLMISVDPEGSGSVNLNNSGPYHYGDVVELTAVPTVGWSFDHWTGDLTGSANPATLTITGDKVVNAMFTKNVYILTTSVVGDGFISLNSTGPYYYGDIVELTAVPAAGWSFDHWDGDLTGSTNPTTILINGNKDVNASFNQIAYTLDTPVIGSGIVSVNDTGPYHYGDVVELTAVPDVGWSFDHWSGDLTGSTNPNTITLTENKAVAATFTRNIYNLTVSTDGNGSVSLNNTGLYYYGDIVELTGIPDSGWKFDHWSGDVTGFSNPDTVTMIGDKSVTAHFTELVVENHDVAVTNATSYRTVVGEGFVNNITITVENHGDSPETFNVTLRLNATDIGTREVTLQKGGSTSIVFELDGTGFAYANYTLSAYAWPVQNETDIEDNTFIDGRLAVSTPGDLNNDGIVDILDAIVLANAFDTFPGDTYWNADADINSDGIIDILDAIILSNHFLETIL